jgi:hypothetical protein
VFDANIETHRRLVAKRTVPLLSIGAGFASGAQAD